MLTIGDFARLAGVSVRTLRHYDELGLLQPDILDLPSGHRLYGASQIERANRLVALRALGFGLDQVAALLDDSLADTDLVDLMQTRRDVLVAKIEADTQRLQQVESRLGSLNAQASGRHYTTTALGQLHVAGLTIRVDDVSDLSHQVGSTFERVARLLSAADLPWHGPGVGLYSMDGDSLIATAGEQIGPGEAPPGLQLHDIPPAARAVSTTFRGETITATQQAWQELAIESERRGLIPTGPGREIYLQTPFDPGSRGWVVELQQPVG